MSNFFRVATQLALRLGFHLSRHVFQKSPLSETFCERTEEMFRHQRLWKKMLLRDVMQSAYRCYDQH